MTEPRTSRTRIRIAIGLVLLLALGLAVFSWSKYQQQRMYEHEVAASTACKAYAESQEGYHRPNNHYANSLQELYRADLIDKPFANAELGREHVIPWKGYVFKVLTRQGSNALGGARSYLDQNGELTHGYALVAGPAEYNVSGRDTFITNHNGTIFQQDLGPNTKAIVDAMTEFNPLEKVEFKPQ